MKKKPKIVVSLQVDDKWLSTEMLGSLSPHPFEYTKRMSDGWTSLECGLMLMYSGLLMAGYNPNDVWQTILHVLLYADFDAVNKQDDPPF